MGDKKYKTNYNTSKMLEQLDSMENPTPTAKPSPTPTPSNYPGTEKQKNENNKKYPRDKEL